MSDLVRQVIQNSNVAGVWVVIDKTGEPCGAFASRELAVQIYNNMIAEDDASNWRIEWQARGPDGGTVRRADA